jgi:hypothetical protein
MMSPRKFPLGFLLVPVLFAVLVAAFAAVPAVAQTSDSVRTKLTVRSFIDYGHIVNGSNPTANSSAGVSKDASMLPLNRTNFLAIQEVGVGNFDVAAGLSGLIWWPYGGGVTDASERVMNVKPMIPVARVRWRFGEPAATSGSLMVGTFGYKYNPDAKNLGEYLYRSGTYPGFLMTTEGWLLMNRANNYSHGALLSVSQFGGALKHNVSLFMETSYFPVGDFSPGYDVSFTQKWFELGGGVVLNHYLALHPSKLEPKDAENSYVHGRDTVLGVDYYGPGDRVPSSISSSPDYTQELLDRWTHKGVKVMGRGAINLNSLLPPDQRNPDDLRIFAEIALLGIENYPLYYEKRSERMPIMFGVNVPTFKMLDVLTLQAEYYPSPFNDNSKFTSASLPIWATNFETAFDTTTFSDELVLDANGKIIPKENHEDDWKWSIYAKKTVNKVIAVHAQVASDHIRLTDGKFNASSVPLTGTPKEWYYLVRLEFALR